MSKNIIVTALVALVVSLGVGFVVSKSIQSNVGGLSELDVRAKTLSIGNTSGTQGTALTFIKAGTATCSGALNNAATVIASTTAALDCNIVGARSGDKVFIGNPAAMTSTYFYVGGYASTTKNDWIVAKLYNNTGANVTEAVIPSTATSSVPFWLFR